VPFDARIGVQVFIEDPLRSKLCEARTSRLVDDLGGCRCIPARG
jgi:hypothetical protein